MALPSENDLKFEAFILKKLKEGMTVNSIAKLFDGEEFEILKQQNPQETYLFLEFITKYSDVDAKTTYKKRVKKIDNINSKFKKLNKADASRMAQGLVNQVNVNVLNDENSAGADEIPNPTKRNRDYLGGLEYDNIKFRTKFGRMTMEEMTNNVEIKTKVRDIFHTLFVGMEKDVILTIKDFQGKIKSLLEAKQEGKELLAFTQSLSIYVKTFKNFVPIPNLGFEATGARDLLVMETGGSREGIIRQVNSDLSKEDLNDEELALIEQDNTPSI